MTLYTCNEWVEIVQNKLENTAGTLSNNWILEG
jgi:hypothetical protein